MSTKQKTENKKGTSKETIVKEIALQLSKALPAVKKSLGEKKFGKRIKKAAKLLSEGIKPNGQEKAPAPESSEGKINVKKIKVSAPRKKADKTASAK